MKRCSFCEEPFVDGETVSIIADCAFHLIPSKVNFALSKDMSINNMYHQECLLMVLKEDY